MRGIAVPIRLAALVALLAAAAGAVLIGRGSKSSAAHWQPLPSAPVAGRLAEAAVWTGRELIVAGGLNRTQSGTAGPLDDGAAFDPATRTWRRIATPPAGVGAGAVWTGSELVAWTGNGPDGPAVAAAYDPSGNSWRRLPAGPLGPREGNTNVWTGKELLVIGGYSGDALAKPIAAALDPKTRTWRVLDGLGRLTLFGAPHGAVWDGHEVIVAGDLSLCPSKGSACMRSRPIVVAYDPATDTARELELPAQLSHVAPIAWTGRTVVFATAAAGALRVIGYTPSTGRWQIGAEAPCRLPGSTDTQLVWAVGRLVVPCGKAGLQIYDVAAGSWSELTPGPSPLNLRAASATAWTGEQLIVWSGAAFERFNPTPGDGASLTLSK